MPAPVALAATFAPQAAWEYGKVLGREALGLRQDVLLAPHINIVRDPLFRRNHTSFSEDPLLTSLVAAAEVAGIQSEAVMAQPKHLAGYNGSDNVIIDERTLREIYLPAFEAVVRAGAASLMCSYNRINGPWACESPALLEDVLRKEWGFDGFVTSDWGAIHSPLAIAAGTDLEMPGRPLAFSRGGPYYADPLKAAVETGRVPVSVLDRAIERIVLRKLRFPGPRIRSARIDVEADAAVARRIAGLGAVLLKNDSTLPLSQEDLASLAVIGPAAGQLAAGFMGERAYGFDDRLISPLAALRSGGAGSIVYCAGVDLTGRPIPAVAAVDLEPDREHKWTGTITVEEPGVYTFMVQPAVGSGAGGGGSITVDGHAVARTGGPGFGGTGMVPRKWSSLLPTTDGRDNGRGSIQLAAGPHRIDVEAHSTGERALNIRFAWITPEMRQSAIASAVAAARLARTVVVFAWNGAGSLTLPEDQDELILRVAAANPRAVVVLNTGGPVAMPWKDKVQAILEMWYPGQEGGWATADILLGRVNPSGKLPVTFPVRLEDAPARAAGHPERVPQSGPPGSAASGGEASPVSYSEGIFVGYHWYDDQEIEPLFPFGHGLSYTRFEYSDLEVRPAAEGFDVMFKLRNAGPRPGSEVAQVYVGPPEKPPVAMARRALAGFQRVDLEPGESRPVMVHIGERELSYWSAASHRWTMPEGTRPVYVGASSRDIRLKGILRSPARAGRTPG